MWPSIAVVLAVLVSGAAFSRVEDKELAASAKHLEGSWEVASAQADGGKSSPESNKTYRFVVSGDRYENRRDGAATEKGSARFVGRKGDVLHLDLEPTDGPGKGVALRLIAEWVDADTLRVSGPVEVGGERPMKFTGEKGSKQILITFKRVKP